MISEKLKLATKSMTNRSEVLVLLLAVFSVGAFIELSYGSKYLGIFFLNLGALVLYFMAKKSEIFGTTHKRSVVTMLTGVILISVSISYNYLKGNEIQTFDSMIMLLGLSLIMYGSGTQFSEIGRFSMYFASIFIVLFLTLFMIPQRVGVDLPYYYGQYAVTIPVLALLRTFNLNVNLYGERVINVNGVEHAFLKIDLACFGWYSLLLVASMLTSYKLTFNWRDWRYIGKIMLLMGIAVYLANLLRVAILVVLTYYYGTETMLVIHSHLGWIFFALIIFPMAYKFLK